ncbi:MAG: hypothetical protein A2909_01315 [Candidatus Tagabacteria bacterium RIFCSPLOWO2_01_FULL_39_11]|uniref:NAD-dependent epimerase/dehydratase domain-containing protein n=1 Tax=Candidatus Tagabacteria bacterium RIFCSPLOWO2_01_FULL_39_11 TaxID=1802295 RepID=A0A1G2LVC0_9BACT|nr:MAG: hypothetical protein A2909_01315 [Candidatus Tagabacteria bacterium RIFCSPLOWO2_01_FULL_39_11]
MVKKENKKLRFLVTGGAGFIGSEITRQLLDQGFYVRVADDLSKKDHQVDKRAEFIRVDLTDKGSTKKVFKGINITINAAAKIGGIGYFHKYPATILSENNKIYSSTFEAAVAESVNRMVYISSSMVFESTTTFPSKEEDVLKIPPPVTAYGFSKLVGEWHCRAFHNQYKLSYSIVRPFNAYGINEFPEEEVGHAHVIPDLIRKILKGQYPLELLGDGEQTRCFTHVADVAACVIAVATHPEGENEDFNIGTDREIKMIDLAAKLWELVSPQKPFKVKFVKGFASDIRRRVPDVTKIKKMINWEPKVDFDQGLTEVIAWLRQQKKQGKF